MIPLPQSFEIPRVQAERCETCRFWRRETMKVGGLESEYGYCHRRAPVQAGKASPFVDSRWPSVWLGEWCGEYQRRLNVGPTMPVHLQHPDG